MHKRANAQGGPVVVYRQIEAPPQPRRYILGSIAANP